MQDRDKKIELLRQRIASLSPEKRAIFEQHLKQQKLNSPPKIVRQNQENPPLSYAQERLWFLHQLDPNNPTYNIAIAWKIRGELDINLIKKTFLTIIERHQSLRTNFISFQGKPRAKINTIPEITLPIIDLQALSQSELVVKNISQTIARQPFNLENEIPVRFQLILSKTESILIIVLDHIIADGWSRGILLEEFSSLYRAFSNNLPSPLEELDIQYGDFAAWQKEWLAKEQQIQLEYWKKQLDNLTVLNLPTDLPRPAIQTFKGRTEFFKLSLELTEKLKVFSRQQGVTLFMTLLTAFKILLHRYSGEKDIAVGTPIANRNLPEVERLIGFFVNTLVLRSDLSKNPTFIDLLAQVKKTTSQAYQYQDLPFARLVEAIHPERNLSQNPLFQVMIQYQNQAYGLQNALSPKLAISNLNLTQEWIDTGATKFDLTWHLIERDDGIITAIEYSSDLFYAETIGRMFGHFQTLLTNIIKKPQARLSNLSILTPEEEKQILVHWNQTDTMPIDYCFHQLFEQQVEKTPNNIAVETSGQSLTYQELNQQADWLADYLLSVGVEIETRVGICLERSPLLIIALLAVQKAGGVYIPLDPNYPQARLDYIIQDSQIKILLTETKYEQIFGDRNLTLINLDFRRNILRLYNAPFASPNPQNLAYIIYTSGSTGKPKGTMIPHQGLVNYLTWAIDQYPLIRGDGVPVHSSISFDATITSLYTALLVGQKIVLFSEESELETLQQGLNSNRNYSIIKLTPAHLNAVAKLSTSESVVKPSQALVIGGEALTGEAIAYWQKKAPQTQLINEYGPTETVVGCCVYHIPPNYHLRGEVPIGNPIANTNLYILDEYLQPVPIGIPGELYIGGAGVARGYLNQPGLTAEKFIPHPFNPVGARHALPLQGERLYKTGDRAKFLSDGTIVYLGRNDHQVKIHGFRIELGEIETVLSQHPAVKSALVLADESRLVAYVVGDDDAELSAAALRSYLQEKLPSYMIPGFVFLDRFPLTVNGKIDKKALPIPNLQELNRAVIEPRTEKEHILAEIWQGVLNLKQVGVEDNFFELGGDSILSIQIIARARQAGLTLTPKHLFQYQTIAELAAVAEENQPIGAQQELVTGEIPLTPIQHWFFEQNLIDVNHYNQAILLEVSPNLNSQWLNLILQHLISHHDALRIGFSKKESGWMQFNLETVKDVPFVTVDLTTIKSDEQSQCITEIANGLQRNLDISQGKMVTGALFRLGNNRTDRLLLIIHHLVVDGVSWRILLEDLARGYQQLQQEKRIQLPSKTASYKDWGKKLKQYAQAKTIEAESDFWLRIGNQSITSLPVDRTSPKINNTVASTRQISISLDAKNSQLLLTEVSKAYNTRIEDVLITALIQSFYLWTNSKELLLDLESYGRGKWDDIDISRTVGWFTAIYPVRLQIDFINLAANLKSIKEQLRSYSNQGFNYGILKYLASKSRQKFLQLSSAEIAFNYLGQLNQPTAETIIQGLATESIGDTRNPLSLRRYLLEINGMITDDKLQINWVYSQNFHERETIASLADNFLKALKNIVKHCLSSETSSYTPSDFTAAKVNQNQLDKLLGKINKKKN